MEQSVGPCHTIVEAALFAISSRFASASARRRTSWGGGWPHRGPSEVEAGEFRGHACDELLQSLDNRPFTGSGDLWAAIDHLRREYGGNDGDIE